ncbi:unnamed protein product, partial [Chrysoparadoxa australica]
DLSDRAIDLIGDIHGHVGPLTRLLDALGYELLGDVYRHPRGRKVLFLGDLIDRGPDNVVVVRIVRKMVESGEAVCLMGNHELNAIHFATEHPTIAGRHLRPRSDKNLRQHLATLSQYHALDDGGDQLADDLEWFKTLPLWIDLPEFRAVHACWSESHIRTLSGHLAENDSSQDFWHATAERDHTLNDAIEVVLKGAEVALPTGIMFSDKDGHVRSEARLAWWVNDGPWPDRVLGPPNLKSQLAAVEGSPATDITYGPDEKPIFFGHYWFQQRNGQPWIAREPNIACLDFSVAKPGGLLTAYRWDGETALSANKLIAVPAIQ